MAMSFRTRVPGCDPLICRRRSLEAVAEEPDIAEAGRTTFRLPHRRFHNKYWINMNAAMPIIPKSVSGMELIRCNVSVSTARKGTFGAIPFRRERERIGSL